MSPCLSCFPSLPSPAAVCYEWRPTASLTYETWNPHLEPWRSQGCKTEAMAPDLESFRPLVLQNPYKFPALHGQSQGSKILPTRHTSHNALLTPENERFDSLPGLLGSGYLSRASFWIAPVQNVFEAQFEQIIMLYTSENAILSHCIYLLMAFWGEEEYTLHFLISKYASAYRNTRWIIWAGDS